MDKYTIKLDRHVLKQLGSQLYGDTPSVIAELVANSYDADAKNVWITIDTVDNTVLVEDDGKGMSADDINNSFLNIGYDKRNSEEPTNLGRKIMGRKGIGKLAAFSLTNCVVVCSMKNGKKSGCVMDFKKILENGEPQALSPQEIHFDSDKLSDIGTGTRIELRGVKKRIALTYRFIVNKLIRTFDVNDEDFKIHIKRQDSDYKVLRRLELNYFTIMDTIMTIGDEHKGILDAVKQNSIPEKYKKYTTFSEYVDRQKKNTKNKLKQFPYPIEVEDANGNETTVDFQLHGWIGTVSSLPELKKLADVLITNEDEEDKIVINDNRISLYSRGKLGEYDILPKVKNNRNSEAYVIGELFIDVFEEDSLADMAISNRRGYDEGDNRYIETIKIVKRLLGYIVEQKDCVQKQRKEDEDATEIENIKKQITQKSKSKEIFEKKLTKVERDIVQEENLQFARAVTSSRATKKIFISHNTELKMYGQFIVDVLKEYGIDVYSTVIFTSDPQLGVPQGRDIYDYLRECFRDELMVVFLFSKAFYDSNVCISEAGAAWATNKNCLNAVIDIEFTDISKPSNNTLSGLKIKDLHSDEQQIKTLEFFSILIEQGLNQNVNEEKLKESIQKMINSDKYCDEKIDNPPIFFPKRKFLPKPLCTDCRNQMKIISDGSSLSFQCSNVSCEKTLPIYIK